MVGASPALDLKVQNSKAAWSSFGSGKGPSALAASAKHRGGRLHLLDPGPAAIASACRDDALSPPDSHSNRTTRSAPAMALRQNGVLVAGLGAAEIDVEDDAFGILLDEAVDQAGMHRARPVMR